MVSTDLLVAGSAAVIAPAFLTPLAAKLPIGGQYAPAIVGVVLIYASTKTEHGLAKAALAGAGVGLVLQTVLPAIISVAR